MRKIRRLFMVLLSSLSLCSGGDTKVVDLSAFFQEAGYAGAFVMYDPGQDLTFVYNEERANRPLLPASTFKVFNSLVALESGAVADENEVIAWDGKVRHLPAWNRDHTLASAIKHSVVWYYQELARRTGPEKMKDFLDRADYGNGDLSAGIDKFWLEGPFRVTMLEQIDLLKKLHAGDLPFSKRSMDIVKSIMIVERTPDYVLRGKTGLAFRAKPMIGWWIGYVEREKGAYFFATTIEADGAGPEGLPVFLKARKSITRKILTHLKVL